MGRRPSYVPPGSWPPRMQAEMAAAYCGEKHVEDFLVRVGKDYPKPRKEDSQRRRFWHRDDLDRALGIAIVEPAGMGARFREARAQRSG